MEQWKVKSLQSAETFILTKPGSAPPVEKTVTLANIECPKLARKPGEDEPYAWESRELTRKLTIGKVVDFQFEYTVDKENFKREFGQIFIQGKSVGRELVAAGLATVRRGNQRTATVEELEQVQEQAKKDGKGRWAQSGNRHVRTIKWEPEADEEAVQLGNKLAGKQLKAIVEAVMNTGMVKLCLLPSQGSPEYQMVPLAFTGVTPPKQDQPYTPEGKFCVELALLLREVTVLFEGVDRNRIVGSVVQNDQCYQTEIVKRGFVAINNFTIAKAKYGKQLRDAETEAKEKRVGLWKNFVATPVSPPAGPQLVQANANAPVTYDPFTGLVLQVNNGDTLIIRKPDGTPLRVTLSNTRAQKLVPQAMENGVKVIVFDGYAMQAREALRKATIGKQVHVTIDYTRNPQSNTEKEGDSDAPQRNNNNNNSQPMLFGTVIVESTGVNVAEMLLKEGFATVQHAGKDKAPAIDDLTRAEEDAKANGRGRHRALAVQGKKSKVAEAEKSEGDMKVVDLIRPPPAKAKQYLGFLQRGNARVRGVVEAVLNPARFRVYIPNNAVVITVAMTGLTTPSVGRKNPDGTITEKPEPLAQEGMDYAKLNFLQRDCEIDIDSVDNNGVFWGGVWVNNDLVGSQLLKKGFATLSNGIEKSRQKTQLKASEKEGQANLAGLFGLPEDQRPRGRQSKRRLLMMQQENAGHFVINIGKPFLVTVTDVASGTNIWAHTEATRAALQKIESALTGLDLRNHETKQNEFKSGDIVVARFSDEKLYRAKVTKDVDNNTLELHYIDWGNRETTPKNRVWKVPSIAAAFKELPEQATSMHLAFISISNESELFTEAGHTTQEFCTPGRQLWATQVYTDGPTKKYYVIHSAQGNTDDSAQAKLVKEGLARVQLSFTEGPLASKQEVKPYVEKLVALQEKAKQAHINLWRYGDAAESDED